MSAANTPAGAESSANPADTDGTDANSITDTDRTLGGLPHAGGTIGVVINPTAGRGRGAKAGAQVITALTDAGYQVLDLTGPTMELAWESASAAVRHPAAPATEPNPSSGPVDVLVVVGGDGMVHLGVNAVAGTRVPLAIVAVGTGNDFASAMGLPTSTDEAIATLLESLANAPRAVDVAQVTGNHLRAPRWVAGVVSAGVDAAVNAHANSLAWPRGRSRYAISAIREISRFRPYGYKVRLEGVPDDAYQHLPEHADPSDSQADPTSQVRMFAGSLLRPTGDALEWDAPGSLIAIANGPRIGGGIRIAPDARIDDSWLDVIVAGAFTRLRAAAIFPGMYKGKHLSHPRVGAIKATRATIEPTSTGAPPPHAFGDGEHIGPLPVTIELHPGALLIYGPNTAETPDHNTHPNTTT